MLKKAFKKISDADKKAPSVKYGGVSFATFVAGIASIGIDPTMMTATVILAGGTLPTEFLWMIKQEKFKNVSLENSAEQNVSGQAWAVGYLNKLQQDLLKLAKEGKTDLDAELKTRLNDPKAKKALQNVKIVDEDNKPIAGATYRFVSRPAEVEVIQKVTPAQYIGEQPQKPKYNSFSA